MRKLIIVLVTINLIFGAGWLISSLWRSHYVSEKRKKEQISVADQMEKAGWLKRDDHARLNQASLSIRATGTIKDQDVEWASSVIHESFKKNYGVGSMGRLMVLLALMHDLKRVTPDQREKLYSVILPMATTHDKNDTYATDKIFFCYSSRVIGEPKAIPLMLPLLNDPRQSVRKAAQRAIDRIQKQLAHPAASR